jgi:hypothetical protein
MKTSFSSPILVVVSSVLLMCLVGCATNQDHRFGRITQLSPTDKPSSSPHPVESLEHAVSLGVVSYHSTERVRLRLTNGSGHTILWHGYDKLPFCRLRQRSVPGWKETPVSWCGTGAATHKLRAGRFLEFDVPLGDVGDQELRVGLIYQIPRERTDFVTWSPPFEPHK